MNKYTVLIELYGLITLLGFKSEKVVMGFVS